jgi:hypothetical protein
MMEVSTARRGAAALRTTSRLHMGRTAVPFLIRVMKAGTIRETVIDERLTTIPLP